jgi:hypothetical protein
MRDLDTSITQLAAQQGQVERYLRRAVLISTLALGALTLTGMGLIVFSGGPWALRDSILTGCLAMSGLTACYGSMVSYRIVVGAHTQLLDAFRAQADLLRAVREAAKTRR